MTEPGNFISDQDVHAYVDGQLEGDQLAEVDRELERDPQLAARVNAYRAQNRALRETFDPILDERLPERLLVAATARRRSIWSHPQAIAAGIALLIIGGVAGWSARDLTAVNVAEGQKIHYTKYAVSAHKIYTKEVRHAVEVEAKEEKHLVRWLSKRVGGKLKVPSLKSVGFDLVGGRLLATPDDAHAAQFMFQDEKMRRLTLYVRSANVTEPTAFRYERDEKSSMFYWIDSPLAYALIGPLSREELSKISFAVYEQISP